eukprot:TRINITY_DN22376_c0_g1_i1.p1 TRINITY_DN22376_c0_g1~~TRINITY_DN22376_c0_g1_i1.p1  ORF type:complete len:297 (+),score=46.35 TRINITY_DN22376_c0_g1_i1:43-891(+)
MRWVIITTMLVMIYNRKKVRRALYKVKYGKVEWKARVELAALYRIAAKKGWDEVIYNHITLRIPGEKNTLLINPFGLKYEEVTASNLLKIDFEGNVLDSGSKNLIDINLAGLVIHSAVHKARPDVHCVIHHHTTESIIVSTTTEKFIPLTQNAAVLFPQISPVSHPYEGIAVDPDEQSRIVSALGQHNILLMENHGCLITGPSVHAAWWSAEGFDKSCKQQVDMMKATGGDLSRITRISSKVVADTADRLARFQEKLGCGKALVGKKEFDAVLRNMHKDFDA